MQLHACSLLFFVTTDKTVSLSHQRCGGNVTSDQEPEGHISLLLPGLFNHTSMLNTTNQQSEENLPFLNCTWELDMPSRRKVLLKLKWMESDGKILSKCTEEDQILQSHDETVSLSNCDEEKAVLSWTGQEIASNSIQSTYYVQEDEINSLEGQNPNVSGATYKSDATAAQKTSKGTEGKRSLVYGGQMWNFGVQSASSASSQDKESSQPTSSQWGLTVTGRTDRETLPLPEEKRNNGADTSGAAHLTKNPMTITTRPYFQPPVSTETESQTTDLTQGQTETSWTDTKVSLSMNIDLHRSTSSQMLTKTEDLVTQMDEHTAVQTNQTVSSFNVLNSSFSGILSDSNTVIDPHGGAVGQALKDKDAHSDRFYSALNTTTSSYLKPSIQLPQHDSNKTQPTSSSQSSPQGSRWAPSPTTHMAEILTAEGTLEPASLHLRTAQGVSSTSDITTQKATSKSADGLYNTDGFYTIVPSTHSQTSSPKNTGRPSQPSHSSTISSQTSTIETQTATQGMQRNETNVYISTNTIHTLFNKDGSFSTTQPPQIIEVNTSSATPTVRKTYTPPFTQTLISPTISSTSYMLQTQTELSDGAQITFSSSMTESSMDRRNMDPKTTSKSSQIFHLSASSATVSPHKSFVTTGNSPSKSDSGVTKGTTPWQRSPSNPMKPNPPGGPTQSFYQNRFGVTSSELAPTPKGSSTKSPIYYIVPNQPATIRAELVESLLQIVVEESLSTSTAGSEEDMMSWLEPYSKRAPGYIKSSGVWGSGHAVQNSVVFKTSEASQWLSLSGTTSSSERTGLAQAVLEGKMFRSSRITNITVGGLQGDVCDWSSQCPSGYTCVPQPGTTNYSCSSTCRFNYCHHHGICTHHPGQLPVCRCLTGDDFWYMGQRCDIKMTRARLISACLAILLIIVMVISILACSAVRRYRTISIQTKVDQTRSSYRRFNHFDESSGRFWLRSWAGSTDSSDNPAYIRSDELSHSRALDRPCCYHDDTSSLPSTCPSHRACINTIFPHSSQYGWRGSGMSIGDGVLDSGKASDSSVCSWPVEPIHWTPFPLLQQLSSHRNPAVRMSRPRSYCEGMELVDMGKSWTA